MKSIWNSGAIIAAALGFALTGNASAHPGGHDEDQRMPYQGYDCQRMAGSYETQQLAKVRVTVFEGTIVITPAKGEAAVGECISPIIDGQSATPRAKFDFGKGFGEALAASGCCIVRLKETSLVFDGAKGIEWKRSAPQ